MNKTTLRKYAQLIAAVGVNVQKGQEVFITAGLDQPEFVAMVVDACYHLGASRVVVDWDYQPLEKLHVRHQSIRTLSVLRGQAALPHLPGIRRSGRPEGCQPKENGHRPPA